MEAIKSFTSLEQSRKLAEILPIESADMYYEPSTGFRTEPSEVKFGDIKYAHPRSIECWSLAALINIIPQEIFDGEYIVNITEGRDNKWIITYDHYEHSNHSYYGLSTGANNLVDACTDIIIKLKERNII